MQVGRVQAKKWCPTPPHTMTGRGGQNQKFSVHTCPNVDMPVWSWLTQANRVVVEARIVADPSLATDKSFKRA
ncbi:hypothetical protein PGTUg99_022059 [Puccinia graminis f. sp. tritici]|uniref:Uncharacterized protein n=1 Tax=Puccinia graminis f. sp. tritici TaxID=56615 RepID=A0A5B0LX90_PUCGR|nr:hypothetical protein PGTUg99_022059 [Puccinia graminis f. sp. tritici]